MEIQGPLTVEELQEANVLAVPKLLRGSIRRRLQNRLAPSKWQFVLFALVAVLVLAKIVRDPEFSGGGRWLPPVLLIGIAAYQYFLGPKMARHGYERRIRRIPRVMSVDSDGLRFEDSVRSFQFRPWSSYKTWREGSLVFLLRGPQRVTNIVPKRGLTPQQIDELRVQLATHMPDSA